MSLLFRTTNALDKLTLSIFLKMHVNPKNYFRFNIIKFMLYNLPSSFWLH